MSDGGGRPGFNSVSSFPVGAPFEGTGHCANENVWILSKKLYRHTKSIFSL